MHEYMFVFFFFTFQNNFSTDHAGAVTAVIVRDSVAAAVFGKYPYHHHRQHRICYEL